VAGPAAPPTIGGFTPTSAVPGTLVTISGTGFDAVLTDVVTIGTVQANVASSTSTTLKLIVPPTCPSGYIALQASGGQAVSGVPLSCTPPPYTSANTILTTHATIGSEVDAIFTAPNQAAVILFDGSQGQAMRLIGSTPTYNFTASPYLISVYNPDGTQLLADTATNGDGTMIDLPTLPMSGVYSVLVKGTIGEVQLIVTNVPTGADFAIYSILQATFDKDSHAGSDVGTYAIFVSYGTSLSVPPTISVSGVPSWLTSNLINDSRFDTSIGANALYVLVLSPNSTITPGTYPFTITGTNGTFTHNYSASIMVQPTFAIFTSLFQGTLFQGTSATYSIGTTAIASFSGPNRRFGRLFSRFCDAQWCFYIDDYNGHQYAPRHVPSDRHGDEWKHHSALQWISECAPINRPIRGSSNLIRERGRTGEFHDLERSLEQL
jgi:hypothetical protein